MSYTSYTEDRTFTDKVHKLAVEKLYPKIGIVLDNISNEELKIVNDNKRAIDYQGTLNGNKLKIQERFRRYTNNSFTLRYMRENSEYEVERFSEFFKLKQELAIHSDTNFYLVYGVPNYNYTDFVCVAIIDLKIFYKYIKNKKIVVDINQLYDSTIKDDVLVGAVFKNRDSSSCMSFFNFDQINTMFPDIIVYQEGFKITNQGTLDFITNEQIETLTLLSAKISNIKVRMVELLSTQEADILIDTLKNIKDKDIIESVDLLVSKKQIRYNPFVLKTPTVPKCPNCNMPLKYRNGKHGFFWGCSNYPDCRYTKPI